MAVVFDHDRFALARAAFYWPQTDEQEFYSNPIERTGGLLVKQLARVGWEVPGIDVEIRTDGCGENVIRAVRTISGMTEAGPFELKFGSVQERRGRWAICPGLSEATIPPGIQLVYHNDRSGPVAYLYVGKDWKADGESFIADWKVNSKQNGKPKTYIRYSGDGAPGVMRYDDDLGREYSPTGSQPHTMDSELLAMKICAFIEHNLLARLAEMPSKEGFDDVTDEGDANLRRLAEVEKIPAPEDFPVLFAWVERNDAYRLRDMHEAEPDQRYGLTTDGARLCTLSSRYNVPNIARRGFSYASADPRVRAGHCVHGPKDDASPVAIKLKYLNDVYVVDNAAFERAAEKAVERAKNEGRKRLTDAELDECIAATAKTIVPVTEYTGGFEQVTYVIGRQTDIDEVRLTKGVVEAAQADGRTWVTLTDGETGHAFVLFHRDGIGPGAIADGKRAASDFSSLHSGGRFRDRIAEPEPQADPDPDGTTYRMV